MLETMIIDKEKLVMMHMMCCIAIFDSYVVYFSNTIIDCDFATIREIIKYCIVSESCVIINIVIINIVICQIRCL